MGSVKQLNQNIPTEWHFSDVIYVPTSRSIRLKTDNLEKSLTKQQADILNVLINNPSTYVSAEKIIKDVWKGGSVELSTISSLISSIRRIFKSLNSSINIQSKYRLGYSLSERPTMVEINEHHTFNFSPQPETKKQPAYLLYYLLVSVCLVAVYFWSKEPNNSEYLENINNFPVKVTAYQGYDVDGSNLIYAVNGKLFHFNTKDRHQNLLYESEGMLFNPTFLSTGEIAVGESIDNCEVVIISKSGKSSKMADCGFPQSWPIFGEHNGNLYYNHKPSPSAPASIYRKALDNVSPSVLVSQTANQGHGDYTFTIDNDMLYVVRHSEGLTSSIYSIDLTDDTFKPLFDLDSLPFYVAVDGSRLMFANGHSLHTVSLDGQDESIESTSLSSNPVSNVKYDSGSLYYLESYNSVFNYFSIKEGTQYFKQLFQTNNGKIFKSGEWLGELYNSKTNTYLRLSRKSEYTRDILLPPAITPTAVAIKDKHVLLTDGKMIHYQEGNENAEWKTLAANESIDAIYNGGANYFFTVANSGSSKALYRYSKTSDSWKRSNTLASFAHAFQKTSLTSFILLLSNGQLSEFNSETGESVLLEWTLPKDINPKDVVTLSSKGAFFLIKEDIHYVDFQTGQKNKVDISSISQVQCVEFDGCLITQKLPTRTNIIQNKNF